MCVRFFATRRESLARFFLMRDKRTENTERSLLSSNKENCEIFFHAKGDGRLSLVFFFSFF